MNSSLSKFDTLFSAGFNPYATMSTTINKVLIVEDEPFWQLLISKALQRIDKRIEVSFSENATKALEIIRNNNNDIDFIIADQLLEGPQTGLDLWDTLVKKEINIPYILVSGIKREDLINSLMLYRTEAIPTFIEKSASASTFSELLKSHFFESLLNKWRP